MIKKAIIDDGCNPELTIGASFDGLLEIPLIKKPEKIIIPNNIIPFSVHNRHVDRDSAVGFYENDVNFADVLRTPKEYVDDFGRFGALISPDCSLYQDAPLAVQITNVYRNRLIGSYYQRQGLYVIPQVRWGTSATYTTESLPERVAFLGIEKRSIVAVGTYGCIKTAELKREFKRGLAAMLETLEPIVVLVYGAMPDSIFGEYSNHTKFVQFNNWIKNRHGGD